ncbi:MAG: thiopeptide-type bacteriocin biosynthesis protein [Chitinophagaceae bacterium]|nr:thiopeptide-type bacteriocin biosynthesis protein [Chitinophagaceae bacterium]
MSESLRMKKGNFYNNEFIAPLIKTEKVYSSSTLNLNDHQVQRNFPPGSEWVYYKLYCGIKSADKILLELIYPLVVKFLSDNKIDKWFFIRYNDPDFHLRLRFHLTDKNNFGEFIKSFSSIIADFEKENIIWKTDLATYQRELIRYTPPAMDLSETLFCIDSMQKLLFLKATAGDEREDIRWLWGIKIIDQILYAFNFPLEQKYLLVQTLKDNFSKEFNVSKIFFQQLNKKYRLNKIKIEKMIKGEEILITLAQLEKEYSFNNIAIQILSLIGTEKNYNLNNIVSSYIHMSLNRLFISSPRMQEMIVYDFLFQYYNGEIKRKANMNN